MSTMMSEQQPTPEPSPQQKLPILGILSTIFGGISMVPFGGIVSPVGLILGIIGLIYDPKKLMAIIGTSLSTLGILTSPILWGLVLCALDPDACSDTPSQEAPQQLQPLEDSTYE